MQHYTDFPSFTRAFIAFFEVLRSNGMESGIQESIDTLVAALHGLWHDRSIFRYALASLHCQTPEDRVTFDHLFDSFWNEKGSRVKSKTTYKNQTHLSRPAQPTVVMMGFGQESESLTESRTTSGASMQESLKQTDFALINQIDNRLLDELVERLLREMSMRLKRKRKVGKKGPIDIGLTIRKNITRGDLLLDLKHRRKKQEKYRLNLLLDVSGSMDKYSFYLLRFIWSLRSHFKNVEAFAFSTRLERITDYLSEHPLSTALQLISLNVNHWSGGTQIGKCLEVFNREFGKRILNGKSITIILSDGLDTGKPDLLAQELGKIKRRTNKLIWLNPLKGMEGYQPVQKGMSAALNELDIFRSAHNLHSLLQLEDIIANA